MRVGAQYHGRGKWLNPLFTCAKTVDGVVLAVHLGNEGTGFADQEFTRFEDEF